MNITEKLFPTFPTHFGTGTHTHSFRMTNEKRDSLFHHIRGTFQNFRVKMRKHVPFAVNTVFLEFDELEEATEDGVVGAAGVVGVWLATGEPPIVVVVSGPGWGEGMITRRESVVREEAKLKVGKGGGEKVVSTPSVLASEARGTLTVPLVVAVEVKVGGGVKGVT